MSDQFKVGTICIGQNFVHFTGCNGMECEIIGGLEMRACLDLLLGHWLDEMCYDVRWADGSETYAYPSHLRRKPPKQSDSQWADEAIRKLKKQSSDHVAGGSKVLIPEEA